MLDDYVFFKNSDGALYGVAPRVIEAGFFPEDGHAEATQEEKEEFIQKTIVLTSLKHPESEDELRMLALDLRDKGILLSGIKKLFGVDLDEIGEVELDRIELLRIERNNRPVEPVIKSLVEPELIVEPEPVVEQVVEPVVEPVVLKILSPKPSLPEDPNKAKHNALRLEKKEQRKKLSINPVKIETVEKEAEG